MVAEDASLLPSRGSRHDFSAYVVGAAFNRSGMHIAWGLGDGSLRVAPLAQPHACETIQAHDGGMLALSADAGPDAFLTGGDDGRFLRINAAGDIAEIASFGGKWVEHVHSIADGRNLLLACAAGRKLAVYDGAGALLKTCEHPSTVTGIASDAKGKRLAAAHYNGATLWFATSKSDTGRKLEWKGSHIGIAMHPAADALVTAMQDNALHGWRLPDEHDMRMSGYPAKTESMSFTRNGRYLATSGADSVVLWPFFGGGPMGKPPLELAQMPDVLVTRVAAHPVQDIVAAGYADGTVLLGEIASRRVLSLAPAGHGPVTALAWSPDGAWLAFGTEQGAAGLLDLRQLPS